MPKKRSSESEARAYFQACIDRLGGPAAAARHFDIPFTTIASICSGQKGIGPKTAERMMAKDRMLDGGKLMWVRPLKAVH